MSDEAAGFLADAPAPRRRAMAPPLDVWIRAFELTVLCLAIVCAWAVWIRTPLPETQDRALVQHELALLDRRAEAISRAGGRPLKVLFLGTSRMRSVTLDVEGLVAEARAAGIKRPLAVTTIGLDFGAFQRLGSSLAAIKQRDWDMVVIMPELLSQDYTKRVRAEMGAKWVATQLWGRDYAFFASDDQGFPDCTHFGNTIEEYNGINDAIIARNLDGEGPRLARRFVLDMAARGTHVVIADIPVTATFEAHRPAEPRGSAKLAEFGLTGQPLITLSEMSNTLPEQKYCDYTHINPANDTLWQRPFLANVAGILNSLK